MTTPLDMTDEELTDLLALRGFSRRDFMRAVSAAGMMGAGASLLAACGSSAPVTSAGGGTTYTGPKVSLAFWNGWTGGTQPQILVQMLNQFNSDHNNIAVTNNTLQWADLLAKAPAAVKAGQGPDVGVMHGDDVATFAAQGLILPLDDMVNSLGYSASDFPSTIFDAVTYQGKRYAIPFSVTPLGLYYNKSVLQAAGLPPTAPTDNQSYIQALQAMKAKSLQGSWTDPFTFTGLFQFETLLWQYGGELYNKDVTQATFNSDSGVKALTWMVDLIQQGYSPPNVGQDADFIALQNGKTAFNWNGVWQASTLQKIASLQWGVAPVPQIGSSKRVWSSSTHFVVYKKKVQDSNATQASQAYIKWFLDHSNQWAAGGELPAKNDVRTTAVQAYPVMSAFDQELSYAHFETASPGISSVTEKLVTAVNSAVLLQMSPKQALDQGADQATKQLQQNRSIYNG